MLTYNTLLLLFFKFFANFATLYVAFIGLYITHLM